MYLELVKQIICFKHVLSLLSSLSFKVAINHFLPTDTQIFFYIKDFNSLLVYSEIVFSNLVLLFNALIVISLFFWHREDLKIFMQISWSFLIWFLSLILWLVSPALFAHNIIWTIISSLSFQMPVFTLLSLMHLKHILGYLGKK